MCWESRLGLLVVPPWIACPSSAGPRPQGISSRADRSARQYHWTRWLIASIRETYIE